MIIQKEKQEKKQIQHPNLPEKLTYVPLIMSCLNPMLMKVMQNILVLDKYFGTSNTETANF